MRLSERILFVLTRGDVLVHLGLVSQVERDGAVHLLESQGRKRCANRLGRLAVPELADDERQGHTTLSEIKNCSPSAR